MVLCYVRMPHNITQCLLRVSNGVMTGCNLHFTQAVTAFDFCYGAGRCCNIHSQHCSGLMQLVKRHGILSKSMQLDLNSSDPCSYCTFICFSSCKRVLRLGAWSSSASGNDQVQLTQASQSFHECGIISQKTTVFPSTQFLCISKPAIFKRGSQYLGVKMPEFHLHNCWFSHKGNYLCHGTHCYNVD